MSDFCSAGCGHCGRCTASYERETDDVVDDACDDATEVCENCFGAGEVIMDGARGQEFTLMCRDCNGRGYYREEVKQ